MVLLVYNEQENAVGVWQEGWEIVLVEHLVPTYCLHSKRIRWACVAGAVDFDKNWQIVGEF